tara:strand:+ start:116 stop:406 length:291 start_codon:yes stop_codon:yes gene_type:complete
MKNTILLDVQQYLQNAYPTLSDSEIDLIAGDVSRRWDYSLLIDNVDVKVRECAHYANIPLRASFNTDNRADISDNERDEFVDENDYEPMEHDSEGC